MDEHEHGKGKTETLINTKKDEQERIQKKTFTNWVNTYLIHANPPYKIDDICESVKNGLCLIHLLESMTGEKLRHEHPKNMQRIHCLSNINTALEFLKNKKIKLVNINATDIADGKPAIVLGLIWTVILFFQIEEQEEALFGSLGEEFKGKGNARKALLGWVNKTIGEKYNMNVTDFGPCWRDGKAFNALVHNIDPNLIDWNTVQKRDNTDNLREAFKQAEQLGIPHILDAQDVDVDKPDEKSIMTYITQFLKEYPDGAKPVDDEIIATKRLQEESALKAREEEEAEAERKRIEAEEELKKRQQEAEQKRQKEMEERRKKEEVERKQKEEEERKRKEEEERRQKEEEEKRRKEEERKRKEEAEKKRKEEEERKRKEEERKQREEAERKRKEEEERKRKEEERKQREEVERKRKEDEERKRKEEERKQREEAERKRKEEEERKRREEERKQKEEAERKQKEEDRKRKEEEERQRKLHEEKCNRDKFSDQLANVENWIDDLDKFLDSPLNCDNDSICGYLNNLNSLLEDKDPIETDLIELKEDIKMGLCGNEYVKPFLGDILAVEKKLKTAISRANNIKNALTQNCTQLKSCEQNIDNVFDWIELTNNIMKDIDHSSSFDECDSKVLEFKAHISDEQKAFNALKDAKDVYSKLKAAAPKNLNDENLKAKIVNVEGLLKKSSENQKAIDKSIKEFNTSVTKVKDYQKDFDKKLTSIGPVTNDVSKLKQQLDKIDKLKKSQLDGEKIIDDMIEKRDIALQKTADLHPIQQKIQDDAEDCMKQWEANFNNLDILKQNLLDNLEKCEGVIQSGNKVDEWLKEKESELRSCKSACDSLSQKEAQLSDLRKLLEEIENDSPMVDKYLTELEEMAITDPMAAKKLNATRQQIDSLIKSIKNAIETGEGKVKNHEDFNDKLDIAEEWLDIAKSIKAEATSKEKPANLDEIRRRKDLIDQLLNSKSNGETLIKAALACGECAAKDTASKGKEDILNILRGMNKDFIQVFDGLGAAKQALETKLGKASNINNDLDALSQWTEDFEQTLASSSNADIHTIKELCDDAQAKMHLADNLLNQARALEDPELEHKAQQLKELIKMNLENAQQLYGTMKENQRVYNDFVKSCSNMDNWIEDTDKKILRCGEFSSSNPEDMSLRLKSLEKLASDIKVKKDDLDKVNTQGNELSWSSPTKSEEINSLLDKLNEKYQHLMENVEKIDISIKDDIQDQTNFDNAHHKANRWLNDIAQELLKCSDSKQCSVSSLKEFSRNLENITDNVPQGELVINAALQIGEEHLAHLRKKSIQGPIVDRDAKKIHELDKNWHNFKMQLDQVTKNLQRVKDNIDEFNILKERIEEYIDEKETFMRNPSSTENFKHVLDEMQGFGKEILNLQSKANEISGSVSNSNAPLIAKELSEKYENLKRAMERRKAFLKKTELDKAKRLENDWASYKNALNACEKWIVDTGFRIIDHDFNAVSPEDAQVKLDECLFMCDEIRNFKSEVAKVIAIGKHVADEILKQKSVTMVETVFPECRESEIETDTDHIENSYRNVLENANQTKSRLEDQLTNWRKYRDIVQNNDKYLTLELMEWWRDKKYFAPQTLDEINHSIHQAEDILQDLIKRQSEMKLSKSNCQSALLGNGSRKSFSASDIRRNTTSTTPLSRLAQSVESGLEQNINEIKKFIPKFEKTKQEWNLFERDIEELETWLKDKENIFESKIYNPSIKSSSLNNDQRLEAERLKRDIDSHEKGINELLDKAQRLGKRQVNSMLQRVEDLKRSLKKLLERKDEAIDTTDYVKRKSFSCQNSLLPYNSSETISTQTPPETCTVSTSTIPMKSKLRNTEIEVRHKYEPSSKNGYGLRNSGGNRGLSKMLYPYCCTADLLNQRLNLDYIHGPTLQEHHMDQRNGHRNPTRMMPSRIRSRTDDSIRRNWLAFQNST